MQTPQQKSCMYRRSVDVTMPYMQGATIDYPFDAYKSYFEILANKDREQLHRIPVSLTFLGMLQTVEFVPVVHLDPSDTYKISIEIFTKRSPTTIGFSLFIVMIMWALSIAIGIIAIQVIRNHRIPDEHILTLGIATLFVSIALRRCCRESSRSYQVQLDRKLTNRLLHQHRV